METSSPTTFRHRRNRNGTWDSICTKCYLTVETAMLEEDLVGAERSHDCAELLAFKATHRGLQPIRNFMHKRNRHGKWDSICLTCFQTITDRGPEPDLQRAEDRHVCNPSIAERYSGLSKEILGYRKKGS